MRLIRLFIIILLFNLMLFGCETKRPLPTLDHNSRIGIINLIEDEITHTHIGLTVFTNSQKKYKTDSQFSQHIEDEVIKILKSNNLRIIKLEPTELLQKNRYEIGKPGMVVDLVLNKDVSADFKKLGELHNIDLFIVICEYGAKDWIGDTGAYVEGYGLYTGRGKNHAYAYIGIYTVFPNPPELIDNYSHYKSYRIHDFEISEDLSPQDINRIGEILNQKASEIARRGLIKLEIVKNE